jgi:glycosyltransferase involved in cell wall biosynthesis
MSFFTWSNNMLSIGDTQTRDRSTAPPCVEVDAVELTILMPCLNEAETLERCILKAKRFLAEHEIVGEVLIADNGSTDGSQAIARAAGARVVDVPVRGYGAALAHGTRAAAGRYVIMGDSDDSYDFSDLMPFLEKLRAGYDLVMGNRFQGGIKPRAMPWKNRYIGNPILSGIGRLFFSCPVRDFHCGLRGYSRVAFDKMDLQTTGMEFASEMVIKARQKQLKITEVPTTLSPDGRSRAPHLRPWRDGWRHLRFMLILCPLWLYMIPAALLVGGGLAVMALLTPGPFQVGRIVFDVHTMLFAALAVMLGFQILWLWVYAKTHGWISGLLPPDTFSLRLFDHLYLERGLLAGFALFLIGVGLNTWLVFFWVGQDLGPLDVLVTLRIALWGFLAMFLGVQTIFGSFFLSMLGLSHRRR